MAAYSKTIQVGIRGSELLYSLETTIFTIKILITNSLQIIKSSNGDGVWRERREIQGASSAPLPCPTEQFGVRQFVLHTKRLQNLSPLHLTRRIPDPVSGFPLDYTSKGYPGTCQYHWNHTSWLAIESRQLPIAQSQVKMQKQEEEEKMREATLHTQDMD